MKRVRVPGWLNDEVDSRRGEKPFSRIVNELLCDWCGHPEWKDQLRGRGQPEKACQYIGYLGSWRHMKHEEIAKRAGTTKARIRGVFLGASCADDELTSRLQMLAEAEGFARDD